MEVERVQQLDRGVRGVHGDLGRDVEERFRVVEDDPHARVDKIVRDLLRRDGRARRARRRRCSCRARRPSGNARPRRRSRRRRSRSPLGLESNTAAMLMPCSAKIGELVIAWPRRPAPTSAMLCCPCVRRILRISDEQRVDRVADTALPELAEVREVAPDLRRVDVRVVGDLLRGDALLAHLLRLGEDLEVAREPRRHPDGQTIRDADAGRTLQHHEVIVPKARGRPFGCHKPLRL